MKVIVKVGQCKENEELCSANCVETESETNSIVIKPPASLGDEASSKQFSFDAVLSQTSSQTDVYEQCKSVVETVLRGQSGSVLAFGQVSW